MICLANVWKTFSGGVHALREVNIQINKGEFVFLVGPSGAGKSTLIKLIYREEMPSQGRVLVGGKDVASLRPREVPFLRRRIGMVFQDYKLLPDKTVYENIAFALEVTGTPRRQIQPRVRHVLGLVGLGGRLRSWPGELSGGEQQRVALARAMVRDPLIILADEPTGNLDPDTGRGIVSLLEDINRLGSTVVVATHAQELVNSMRKRVVELAGGRVVRDQERGAYR
ncbi:MAG TPA: cell division ATP-binding protein FtsE [Clostridiales bacterium UBA8153]|nr:cell division ATP-binding protein FtsE [Clostridiales bacterium UBA8153]